MQSAAHSLLSALHPAAIRCMTGLSERQSPEADARFAFIPKLMARPDLTERSLRQGITLLFLDAKGVLAALVFEDRLFGLLCLPFGQEIDALVSLLNDFQLGWLPPEQAQNLGGHVWQPIDLPAEAEGFAPVFATGPLAWRMQGHARILDNI